MRSAAMALAAGLAAPMAWGQASITEIIDPSPDPGAIILGDINGDGSVVVGFRLFPSDGRAFRWNRDTGVEFIHDAVGGGDAGSSAAAVSEAGSVIAGQVGTEAFILIRDQPELLGVLWDEDTCRVSFSQHVSSNGAIVVGGSRYEGPCDVNRTQAFRWADSQMSGLGFLPGQTMSLAWGTNDDGSIVVGDSGSPDQTRAFVWTESQGMQELPSFEPSETVHARGISADGRYVVGSRSGGTLANSAFRWSETEVVDLGVLPGVFRRAVARDVSADGSVVVGSTTRLIGSSEQSEAFVWTEATGTLAVGQVLADCFGVALHGRRLRDAVAISEDGKVIAVEGLHSDGQTAAFVVSLPIACRVDLDGDGVLTLFDFLLFQNFFDSDDRAADFDCDGELTVFDFLAFQNAFDAGCP